VIVSRGPGSYTGLRVGIMSAKAFAYATGCVFLAVDTFSAIARQVSAEVLRLDVLADAQQDKVYVQPFIRTAPAAAMTAADPLVIRPFADWLAERAPDAWVTGPGLRGNEGRLPAVARAVDPARWDPAPESLLEIGLERYRRGERDDLWAAEPLYLRPSAAEEQWRQRRPSGPA
jgi:tRNA threonylcarbamoyladenosine biosynthesis protein TsaB